MLADRRQLSLSIKLRVFGSQVKSSGFHNANTNPSLSQAPISVISRLHLGGSICYCFVANRRDSRKDKLGVLPWRPSLNGSYITFVERSFLGHIKKLLCSSDDTTDLGLFFSNRSSRRCPCFSVCGMAGQQQVSFSESQ